ncbi:hypothetical protein [Streptomyces sp.]|uniref:hypothetical protein n=1 Tax=Streptomyces sp. TaxID=1931 RepID=UPI002F92DEF9
MGMGVEIADGVDRGVARQKAFVVAAVVAAGLAVGLSLVYAPLLVALNVGTAGVTAMPLMVRDEPKIFARACLVIGSGLVVWGLIGAILGMFLFLPAALLLLIASFVNPGNRPGVWFTALTPVAAAALFASIVALPSDSEDGHEPPEYFVAALDSEDRPYDREFVDGKARLVYVGARESRLDWTSGSPHLVVYLSKDGSSETVVRNAIAALPGVVELRACTHDGCELVRGHG